MLIVAAIFYHDITVNFVLESGVLSNSVDGDGCMLSPNIFAIASVEQTQQHTAKH